MKGVGTVCSNAVVCVCTAKPHVILLELILSPARFHLLMMEKLSCSSTCQYYDLHNVAHYPYYQYIKYM